MDELRTILLLIGIGVILGVYGWTRFQHKPSGAERRQDRPAPLSEADADDAAGIDQELERMQRLVEGRDDSVPAADSEQLIIISVVAPEDITRHSLGTLSKHNLGIVPQHFSIDRVVTAAVKCAVAKSRSSA